MHGQKPPRGEQRPLTFFLYFLFFLSMKMPKQCRLIRLADGAGSKDMQQLIDTLIQVVTSISPRYLEAIHPCYGAGLVPRLFNEVSLLFSMLTRRLYLQTAVCGPEFSSSLDLTGIALGKEGWDSEHLWRLSKGETPKSFVFFFAFLIPNYKS